NPANGQEFINGVAQNPTTANFILMTVWDGGGNDTYDFTNYTTNINADLSPGGWINLGIEIANLGDGHFARGNVANAQLYQGNTASLIENVYGGSGNDVLTGNAANNTIIGAAGADTLNGLDGDDLLIGGAGPDQLDGGTGSNTASYDASPAAVRIDLLLARGTGGGAESDVLDNIPGVVGSRFDDVPIGTINANTFYGGAGSDTLTGAGGADYLDGGDGVNTASYDTSPGAVEVNLATHAGSGADAQGDVLVNIQNLTGSPFGDVLTGDDGPNVL